jgi:NitT/TauT family transport system ATP-binding protein
MPPAPVVAFSDVGKAFANGVVALDRLDLDVREGEFLTLLGPSGCGKSTALRMIAGLSAPSSGALGWREGRTPELGFVFQEPTLMPWANVWNNAYLPLRLRGISKAEAAPAIGKALALVGLEMRVSIARALTLRPPLLLMDEPFAALDEITRMRLNNDLLALKRELGTTIVFVTHSVFESVYLSTRIAVFSARPGRVTQTFDIAGPAVRDEEFRLSQGYADQCRRVSAALDAAMGGAHG